MSLHQSTTECELAVPVTVPTRNPLPAVANLDLAPEAVHPYSLHHER